MLIAALVMYLILALLLGPFWFLDFLAGKAGFLGYLAIIAWVALLIGAITS